MKSLLFTCILSLSFVFSAESQNAKNLDYLKDMSLQRSSSKISEFQNMIAAYNIQQLAVFKSDKETTYDVVFKETNCKVVTTYDASGKIISSSENYNNVKLPHQLALEVIKAFPNWRILKSRQSIEYNSLTGPESTFVIKIKNDNNSKVLKFKQTNDDVNNYVALN
ncbi:hypothetical protein N8768_08335 [Flavobacteriaceae bacterium]|jgi:hypothetical protein|nr:hypothetical protein [Flavobacteriaceae bacterium]